MVLVKAKSLNFQNTMMNTHTRNLIIKESKSM